MPAAPGLPDTPVGVRIAWHSGMSSSPVARRLEQAEREWFSSLAGPGPLTVPDAQYLDFTLSAQDGFVVDSAALPHIAVAKTKDAISVCLAPARPDFRPAEISPLYDMGPGSPVRNPGSGFGPTG